jgi:hypothetical protein
MEPQESRTVETVEHTPAGGPRGPRLAFMLFMVVAGFALVVLGALVDLPLGVRIVLIGGGVAVATTFALLALGAVHLGGTDHVPSADLPQGFTTRKTTVRRIGFPRKGTMPPKRGRSPLAPPGDSERAQRDETDSGAGEPRV